MAKKLDDILDQFQSKGYEVCNREHNAIELHREHGVCIKIKKNLIDYSVFIKIHNDIRLMSEVARNVINKTYQKIGEGKLVGSYYTNSYIEIKAPIAGMSYRLLESYVDSFFFVFNEEYMGLIQMYQMGAYRRESIRNSYTALSDTEVEIGEMRDTSHEGRVHDSEPRIPKDDMYTRNKKSNLASILVTIFIVIFVVGCIVSCFSGYDVYGYSVPYYSSSYAEFDDTHETYDYTDREEHYILVDYIESITIDQMVADADSYINELLVEFDGYITGTPCVTKKFGPYTLEYKAAFSDGDMYFDVFYSSTDSQVLVAIVFVYN